MYHVALNLLTLLVDRKLDANRRDQKKMTMQAGNVEITTFVSDAVALTLQLTRSVLLMHFLCSSVLLNYSS